MARGGGSLNEKRAAWAGTAAPGILMKMAAVDSTNSLRAGKILGLDYGRSRIGVAIADRETRMAQPLATLERINRNEDMRRLRELVREHAANLVIVGLPLRMDGSHGEMADEASRFAERLRKQASVSVEMVDERLTSWEAERLLEEQGGRAINVERSLPMGRDGKQAMRKKKATGKMTVDAIAATVILKEYLDRAE